MKSEYKKFMVADYDAPGNRRYVRATWKISVRGEIKLYDKSQEGDKRVSNGRDVWMKFVR